MWHSPFALNVPTFVSTSRESVSGAPAETGEKKAGAERALLGLALVRAVMEAHRGYAFADEDPSVGNVVHMVLPTSAQSAGGVV